MDILNINQKTNKMKKLVLTAVIAISTLVASAQFTLVSHVSSPADGDSWSVSNFTDSWGVGYNISDNTLIGVYKNGDNYDVFARQGIGFGFICLETPTSDAADNMRIGYGLNWNLWNNLSVSPMYTVGIKEDEDGNRDGGFKLGLSYIL